MVFHNILEVKHGLVDHPMQFLSSIYKSAKERLSAEILFSISPSLWLSWASTYFSFISGNEHVQPFQNIFIPDIQQYVHFVTSGN